jgi:hypothetical protein
MGKLLLSRGASTDYRTGNRGMAMRFRGCIAVACWVAATVALGSGAARADLDVTGTWVVTGCRRARP